MVAVVQLRQEVELVNVLTVVRNVKVNVVKVVTVVWGYSELTTPFFSVVEAVQVVR